MTLEQEYEEDVSGRQKQQKHEGPDDQIQSLKSFAMGRVMEAYASACSKGIDRPGDGDGDEQDLEARMCAALTCVDMHPRNSVHQGLACLGSRKKCTYPASRLVGMLRVDISAPATQHKLPPSEWVRGYGSAGKTHPLLVLLDASIVAPGPRCIGMANIREWHAAAPNTACSAKKTQDHNEASAEHIQSAPDLRGGGACDFIGRGPLDADSSHAGSLQSDFIGRGPLDADSSHAGSLQRVQQAEKEAAGRVVAMCEHNRNQGGGTRRDSKMLSTMSTRGLPRCVMHPRGISTNMFKTSRMNMYRHV